MNRNTDRFTKNRDSKPRVTNQRVKNPRTQPSEDRPVPVKIDFSDWKNSLTSATWKNLFHYRRHMLSLTEAGFQSSVMEVQKLEHGLSNRQSEAITNSLLTRREDKLVYKEKHPYVIRRADNTSVTIPPDHTAHPVTYSLKEHQTQGVSESVTTTCSLIKTTDGRHLSSAVYNFAPSLTSIVDSFPERVSRRNAVMANDIRIDYGKMKKAKEKNKELYSSPIIPVFLTLNVGNLKKETVKPILEELGQLEHKKEKYIPHIKNAKIEVKEENCIVNKDLESDVFHMNDEKTFEIKESTSIVSSEDLEEIQNTLTDENLNSFVRDSGFTHSDIVYISAMPDNGNVHDSPSAKTSVLPYIPRYLLAEMSLFNVHHNTLQCVLAEHKSDFYKMVDGLCEIMNSDKLNEDSKNQLEVDNSIIDMIDYSHLTQRPFSMNQFWDEYSESKYCRSSDNKLDVSVAQSNINLPVPSVLAPLEGTVEEVRNNIIVVKVNMPLPIATQWFGLQDPLSQPKVVNDIIDRSEQLLNKGKSREEINKKINDVSVQVSNLEEELFKLKTNWYKTIKNTFKDVDNFNVNDEKTLRQLEAIQESYIQSVVCVTKHHIISQTRYPICQPPCYYDFKQVKTASGLNFEESVQDVCPRKKIRWIISRGPNKMQHSRVMEAVDRFTSYKYLGSPALRHIVCRMNNLSLFNPDAKLHILRRLLNLNEFYLHQADTSTGSGNVENDPDHLISSLPSLHPIVMYNVKAKDTSTKNAKKRARELITEVFKPTIFSKIASHLSQRHLMAFAQPEQFASPISLLSIPRSRHTIDNILFQRLRECEFASNNNMKKTDLSPFSLEVNDEQNDDSSTTICLKSQAINLLKTKRRLSLSLEQEVVPSTVGRYYFYRNPIRKNMTSSNLDLYRTMASQGKYYFEYKGNTTREKTRITLDVLNKVMIGNAGEKTNLSLNEFFSIYSTYNDKDSDKLKSFNEFRKKSQIKFPTEVDLLLHPQANHNPLPLPELQLAHCILKRSQLLNESQEKAVMQVLNQTLTLLQGPPGTGKTSTITMIVWLWVMALGGTLDKDKKLPDPKEYMENPEKFEDESESHLSEDIINTIGENATLKKLLPHYYAEEYKKLKQTQTYDEDDLVNRLKSLSIEEIPVNTTTKDNQYFDNNTFYPLNTKTYEDSTQFINYDNESLDKTTSPPSVNTRSLNRLQPLNVSSRGPVLVTAYTNVAVDEVMSRLLQMPGFRLEDDPSYNSECTGRYPHYVVLRMGNEDKMSEATQPASLNSRVDRDPKLKDTIEGLTTDRDNNVKLRNTYSELYSKINPIRNVAVNIPSVEEIRYAKISEKFNPLSNLLNDVWTNVNYDLLQKTTNTFNLQKEIVSYDKLMDTIDYALTKLSSPYFVPVIDAISKPEILSLIVDRIDPKTKKLIEEFTPENKKMMVNLMNVPAVLRMMELLETALQTNDENNTSEPLMETVLISSELTEENNISEPSYDNYVSTMVTFLTSSDFILIKDFVSLIDSIDLLQLVKHLNHIKNPSILMRIPTIRQLCDSIQFTIDEGYANSLIVNHDRYSKVMEKLSMASSQLTKKIDDCKFKIEKARRDVKRRILNSASVICTTCIAAGNMSFDKLFFSMVIIDECTQVPEMAALIPLSRMATVLPSHFIAPNGDTQPVELLWADNEKTMEDTVSFGLHPSQRSNMTYSRVVLVGDQCQLPPVVDQERLKLAGLGVSLFERLLMSNDLPVHSLESSLSSDVAQRSNSNSSIVSVPSTNSIFFKQYISNYSTQVPFMCENMAYTPQVDIGFSTLRVQYRMHPQIAAWISKQIYNDVLRSGTPSKNRPPVAGFPWPIGHDNYAELLHTLKNLSLDLNEKSNTSTTNSTNETTTLQLPRSDTIPLGPLVPIAIHKTQPSDEKWESVCEYALGKLSENNRLYSSHMQNTISNSLTHLPIVFVNHNYPEDKDGGISKLNSKEAAIVTHICASLLNTLPLAQNYLSSYTTTSRPNTVNSLITYDNGYSSNDILTNHNEEYDWNSVMVEDDVGVLLESDSHGLFNDYSQNEQVQRILNRIKYETHRKKSTFVEVEEIGVVTGYMGQMRKIKTTMGEFAKKLNMNSQICSNLNPNCNHSSLLNQVEVKTVDGFQGREKDVIVFSCVRSNPNHSMGFLQDLRRLNVGVSRARRGLIIVGNENTLSNHPQWSNYIASIKKNGGYIEVEELESYMHCGLALPDYL